MCTAKCTACFLSSTSRSVRFIFKLTDHGCRGLTGRLFSHFLLQDDTERTRLFRAIHEVPTIHKKAAWAMRWIDSSNTFAQRLVAFACVEGIHFSGMTHDTNRFCRSHASHLEYAVGHNVSPYAESALTIMFCNCLQGPSAQSFGSRSGCSCLG